MKQQTTIQTPKQMSPQTRGLLPHAFMRSTPNHDLFTNRLARSHFVHDFSRLAVHTASQVHSHAALKNLAVPHLWDVEDPAAEEGIAQLVDSNGGPAPVALSPIVTPPSPSPATPSGSVAATVFNTTVPNHIRAASTPAGMPDRIPPRVNTPVFVRITGWSIPMRDVTICVEGAGGGNGTVTVNGANSVDLNASSTVQLRGVTQTSIGNAGALRLVAKQGSELLASSANFSVSSIPQNWSVSFNSLITGRRRGIRVNNNWQSDSGTVADLDQAERSEQVQYNAGSGSLAGAGAGAHNSGYLPANNPPLTDSHGAGVGLLTGIGSIVAEQTFIFKDKRTGANNIPAKNSGYRLSRNVIEPTPGNLNIMTTKQGVATTANGFSSRAGSGSVSRTQAV